MKLTINVPDIDDVIKKFVLQNYFSEIGDVNKLLTELVDLSDKDPSTEVADLLYGDICAKYEDDDVAEIWNLVEGEAQAFLRYIHSLEEKS